MNKTYISLAAVVIMLGCMSIGYLFRSNFVLQIPIQISLQLPFRRIASQSASLIPKAYGDTKVIQAIIPSEVDMFDKDQVKQYIKQESDKTFGVEQWQYLELLLEGESGFNPYITNLSSGACGLFQVHPCTKLGSLGLDLSNQTVWGLAYIKNTPEYGTPQKAYQKWLVRSPYWY